MLFSNQIQANLTSVIAVVEDVLVDRGHVLEQIRLNHPSDIRRWQLQSGSARVVVSIFDESDPHFRVGASIMTIDSNVDTVSLFEHLLKLNLSIPTGSFGLSGQIVTLMSKRSTRDLDRSEIATSIQNIEQCADHYDNILVQRFGGQLGAHDDPL